MERVVLKAYSMLNAGGHFILVVANDEYLAKKLTEQKDLCIEENDVHYRDKQYHEWLHYSEIPEIGTIIDFNREEQYYIDLFAGNGFLCEKREVMNDNGFLCTMMLFRKLSCNTENGIHCKI